MSFRITLLAYVTPCLLLSLLNHHYATNVIRCSFIRVHNNMLMNIFTIDGNNQSYHIPENPITWIPYTHIIAINLILQLIGLGFSIWWFLINCWKKKIPYELLEKQNRSDRLGLHSTVCITFHVSFRVSMQKYMYVIYISCITRG